MEIVTSLKLNAILKASISQSISYNAYRDLVHKLAETNDTTGLDKSEALANYTQLNDRRMRRWDKTLRVPESVQSEIAELNLDQTWLVLTESWCGDAAHMMPVMNIMAKLNTGIDFKVVLRDEQADVMQAFLTRGARAIPKLIMIDNKTGRAVNTYGPRPSAATEMVDQYKTEFGSLSPEFKENLQRWYNKDKGQTAIKDIVGLLRP